jgi:polyhydroxyalkanoate synthesis regulator phasin
LFERLRRRPPLPEDLSRHSIDALERRVADLEEMLQGLQDAVHREAVRRDEQVARLERRIEPRELARTLSEDARERGL